MKAVITLILWTLVTPVYAGSLSFQVVQGGQTVNKTYTIPDADVTRIITAYQNAADSTLGSPATRAQVLQYWITKFISETITDVKSSEINALMQSNVPINPQ